MVAAVSMKAEAIVAAIYRPRLQDASGPPGIEELYVEFLFATSKSVTHKTVITYRFILQFTQFTAIHICNSFCTTDAVSLLEGRHRTTMSGGGKPRVLVLGGAGMIGRNFVQFCVARDLCASIRVADKTMPEISYFRYSRRIAAL